MTTANDFIKKLNRIKTVYNKISNTKEKLHGRRESMARKMYFVMNDIVKMHPTFFDASFIWNTIDPGRFVSITAKENKQAFRLVFEDLGVVHNMLVPYDAVDNTPAYIKRRVKELKSRGL